MTQAEIEILDRLLSVDFDGVETLRLQARFILGVESSCQCGCPSIALVVDREKAPPAHCPSPMQAELVELDRSDGVPRTVICFLADGYFADIECVYYDDAIPEWPSVDAVAIQTRTSDGYVVAMTFPDGVEVRPQASDDAWVHTDFSGPDFTATTWSGYRESFDASGALVSRTFTK